MIDLAPPPSLILPDHWEGKRPAIIRPGDDILGAQRRDARRLGMLPGMTPLTAGKRPPAFTRLSSSSITTDLSGYNFGDFIAPSAGLMIVGFVGSAGGARTLSSVSIGGTNGTVHVNVGGSLWTPIGFASRQVSAGANNVTVTFNSTMNFAAIRVWMLERSLTTAPTDTDGNVISTAGTTITATMDIPALGYATYVAWNAANGGYTWSSASEQDDYNVETGRFASADKTTVSAITNHAETTTQAIGTARGIAGASWAL